MTREDRWKIEGEARESLRESKKNLAALKIQIEKYATQLKEASEHLRNVLVNPTGKGPTGMTRREYALHFFETMMPPEIQTALAEFEIESARVLQLEQMLSEFN